jgi:hypothetical protein
MRWGKEKKLWLCNHNKVLEVLKFGSHWKFRHDLLRIEKVYKFYRSQFEYLKKEL